MPLVMLVAVWWRPERNAGACGFRFEGGGVAVLAEQRLERLRFRRGLTMVAGGATRAPTASSLKGAERTIVYYKGRA